MLQFDKISSRLAQLPWRLGLGVLGASFATASLLSTLLARYFMPEPGKASGVRSSNSGINVPNPTATLSGRTIDLILKRNLFNSAGEVEVTESKDEGQQPVTAEAVKSDLPVKLVGTIFGGDPYSGIALIENNQKKTINSFFPGDAVIKDAILKEIYKERIIVERNGRREYIEIAPTELTRSRRKKKTAPAPTSADPAGLAPIATEPPPSIFKEDGFEREKDKMVMTQAYRSKLLTADFTKVLQDAKATPNMVDGELKGFTINRIRKDSIYEKAGLQNDDIVEEINGVPLSDTSQSIRLLQSLRNEPEIEVRVRRGGVPINFVISIK